MSTYQVSYHDFDRTFLPYKCSQSYQSSNNSELACSTSASASFEGKAANLDAQLKDAKCKLRDDLAMVQSRVVSIKQKMSKKSFANFSAMLRVLVLE